MNEFSILCRVLGSLYYRQPQDPLLVPLFTLIREGKLAASWPLEQDELLARLQKSCEMQSLATDYNALFVGEACSVPPYRSAWVEGSSEAEVRAFLSEHGIPTGESPADHLGSLLLAVLLGQILGPLNGGQGFLGKLVHIHIATLLIAII